MTIVHILYEINETETSQNVNGPDKNTYTYDLPHGDILLKEMCKDWNSLPIHKYFHGILKDRIVSTKMLPYKEKDKDGHMHYYGRIAVRGHNKTKFTQEMINEIDEQISSQFIDGWGEGFFGKTFEPEPGYFCYVD